MEFLTSFFPSRFCVKWNVKNAKGTRWMAQSLHFSKLDCSHRSPQYTKYAHKGEKNKGNNAWFITKIWCNHYTYKAPTQKVTHGRCAQHTCTELSLVISHWFVVHSQCTNAHSHTHTHTKHTHNACMQKSWLHWQDGRGRTNGGKMSKMFRNTGQHSG